MNDSPVQVLKRTADLMRQRAAAAGDVTAGPEDTYWQWAPGDMTAPWNPGTVRAAAADLLDAAERAESNPSGAKDLIRLASGAAT